MTYDPTVERKLTAAEESFALAVVACSGNVVEAARSTFGYHPKELTSHLMADPRVLLRIRELQDALQEEALISMGSHLQYLAELRDDAKRAGRFDVCLQAEKTRGEVVGFYARNNKNQVTIESNIQPVIQFAVVPGMTQDQWVERFAPHLLKRPDVIDINPE